MNNRDERFSSFVKEYKTVIYNVCYMFSKDKEEINDLFQEILIKLWKGMDSFKGESKPQTWIYRVALNVCLDQDRKKKRIGERIPLSVNIDLYDENDNDTKQIRQLYDRINKLEYVDRAIILLWLEALSYDEIGAIIGINPKNVSVKLVRIKDKLKQM